MEIPRKETFRLFFDNWCITCGKVTEMNGLHTGLPGIPAMQCPECFGVFHVNFCEGDDDMVTLPDDAILPGQEVLR